ncbi:MAG: methionine sulfoxide reductase, partial [Bacteroidetes bacterium]|nr:methionine sulfoxide reductase [Bacteroidota bacterium]
MSQTNTNHKSNEINYKIMQYNSLTPEEERVIVYKDTERPF